MVTNICLLLEAFSFVICLHHLYGEKFQLDIKTTSFLAINMIIMTAINYYKLPRVYTMIIYPIIGVYCSYRFRSKLKVILINMVLCVILIGGMQMLAALPFWFICNKQLFGNYELLIMNCLVLLVASFLVPKFKVFRISKLLQHKEKILIIALLICLTLVVLWLLSYKELTLTEFRQAIMLFISIVFIFVLAEQLGISRVRAKEIETELKMHKIYADSFKGLINNIRSRQHEFDNHINVIYSQHYMYKTYNELVQMQKDYCQVVMTENRFNKLLSTGNPIILGFLYGKFTEIDKRGIDLEYKVNIRELNIGVPIYKIVEILGNLIDNAVEAIELLEEKNKIYILLIEDDNKMEIEVRNESPYISYNDIESFFVRGFSKKGKNRGLGLYNVKNICDEYKLYFYCKNTEIAGENWLVFKIEKK